MRGFVALSRIQAKLFLREPAAFFFTLVFPCLLLVIFGAIFGNEPMTHWGLAVGYIDTQVPALAAIILGSVGLIGIPIATSTARETRVLRRYRATPVSPLTIISADLVVNFVMSLAGMIALVVLGKILFGLRFSGSWTLVAAMFTFSAFAFFALGYLIASLSPTARVAQTIGMAAFFPLMFLSGAAMPRQIMPDHVLRVADALPLTHVVELLQTSWLGEPLSGRTPEILWLVAILVAGTALSARFFRWE